MRKEHTKKGATQEEVARRQTCHTSKCGNWYPKGYQVSVPVTGTETGAGFCWELDDEGDLRGSDDCPQRTCCNPQGTCCKDCGEKFPKFCSCDRCDGTGHELAPSLVGNHRQDGEDCDDSHWAAWTACGGKN